MQLYLIRHGLAADGGADEARPLTDEGRARIAEEAQALRRLGAQFDRLLHSPLLRATQTAEALADLVLGTSSPTPRLVLAPSEELLAELAGESVALVGHEPWLSELVAWLVTGERRLGPRFAIEKGGVALLEGEPRPLGMALAAFLPPEALLAIGRRGG
jgi:phosphohistidine phosphatase